MLEYTDNVGIDDSDTLLEAKGEPVVTLHDSSDENELEYEISEDDEAVDEAGVGDVPLSGKAFVPLLTALLPGETVEKLKIPVLDEITEDKDCDLLPYTGGV